MVKMTPALAFHKDFSEDFERLKNLKEKLASLALEKDELLYVQCKNLEMAYMLEVGHLDYELYRINLKIRRSMRKLELVQTFVNRQETVDFEEIEIVLEKELASYVKNLQGLKGELDWAFKRKDEDFLSSDEADRLKALYRRLVFKLHPDLLASPSQEEKELFTRAVQAYKNGDLQGLEVLALLLEKKVQDWDTYDGEETEAELARLKGLIADLETDIDSIKSAYPYNKKELLSDRKKLVRVQEELRASIKTQEKILLLYKSKLKEIEEGRDGKFN